MPHDTPQKPSSANLFSMDVGTVTKKHMEGYAQFHSNVVEEIQQIGRHLLDRARDEAALASEFVPKFAAARSLPDTATVYQDWANRRMGMVSEDANYLFSEGEKFIQFGVHLMSNGWYPGERTASS